MKLNWPNAIVLSFLLFFGFIGYWVVKIETQTPFEHELVHENYYEEEIHFDDYRKAEENAQTWKANLQFDRKAKQLIGFPFPKNTVIEIQGYFPGAQKNDFKLHRNTDTLGLLIISDEKLKNGNWIFIFSWTTQQKAYRIKKEFYY
jgi:hypothetical protein